MRAMVKMIKLCIIFLLFFLMLSYYFSVHHMENPEQSFFKGIPDDFLTSICSGIFASLLVVILCELSRYQSLKSDVEQRIYDTNLRLFTTLGLIKQILKRCINKKIGANELNDLDDFVKNFLKYKDELDLIEYTTFCNNKNSFSNKFKTYKAKLITEQEIFDSKFKLEDVKNDIQKQPAVINTILDNVNLIFTMVDRSNTTLDEYCDKRFEFEGLKEEYRKVGFLMPDD